MDHRVDIYSFDVVSYELLAGRLPFGDRGLYQGITAQFAEKPRDVSLLRPDTPAVVSAMVMKRLERDVESPE